MSYIEPEYRSLRYIFGLTTASNLGALYTGFLLVAFNACGLESETSMGWDKQNDQVQIALVSTAIPFGALFGAIFAGYFGYKIGRRKVILIADILCLVGVLLTLINQTVIFLLGRIITGLSCGINYNIVPLYVREISPSEISGKTGGFFKGFWSLGIFFAFLEALALPSQSDTSNLWKLIMATPAIFAILRFLLFAFCITYDTPKYYLIQNDEPMCFEVLNKIYKQEYLESVFEREARAERAQGFKDVIGSKFRNQLMICFFLYVVLEFTGFNAMSFYSSKIFYYENEKVGDWQIKLFNLGYGSIRILGAILGGLFLDKLGRKPMMVIGCVLTAILTFSYSSTGFMSLYDLQRIFLLIYSAIQSMTIALILPIYVSELLPSNGIGILVVFDCLCMTVVTVTFPFISFEDFLNVNGVFIMFGSVALVATPIMIIKLKETKNKSLYEIHKMFNSNENSGLLDDDTSNDSSEHRISFQKL